MAVDQCMGRRILVRQVPNLGSGAGTLHAHGDQELPDMPLGVLRRVKQKALHRRRQLSPAHASRLEQCRLVDLPERRESQVHLLIERGQKALDRHGRVPWFTLRREPLHLGGREHLSSSITEETVDDTAQVLEVEADGGDPGWARPKLIVGEIAHEPGDLLSRLQQRMGDGLKKGRDAWHAPSEPDLGTGCVHRVPDSVKNISIQPSMPSLTSKMTSRGSPTDLTDVMPDSSRFLRKSGRS